MEKNTDTCGSCKHFIGGGDWNLCCTEMYDLCYRDDTACDKYEYSPDKVVELEKRDRKLAEYVKMMRKNNVMTSDETGKS